MLDWIKQKTGYRYKVGGEPLCLHRHNGNLGYNKKPLPEYSQKLLESGHCILRGVFSSHQIHELKQDITRVFDNEPPDGRPNSYTEDGGDMFRYQMFNRSVPCQLAIENSSILAAIEPLLGDDCHVISNTAWRNPPEQQIDGSCWHIDAGPHVPLPEGTRWPRKLPFPIFVIGTHVYLRDCSVQDGPTGVIPGSHKSGRFPPDEERWNEMLEFEGQRCEPHIVKAGDVGMFVSDVWHRRVPAGNASAGRFFLQTNYARRDIAQRILTTEELNCAAAPVRDRITRLRQRQLYGLHPEHFYDG